MSWAAASAAVDMVVVGQGKCHAKLPDLGNEPEKRTVARLINFCTDAAIGRTTS